MKKIIFIFTASIIFSNISYAEKIECDLLSPMQKVVYKAYCSSQEKNDVKQSKKLGLESGKIFNKIFGGLNTDSTLLNTGKYNKKNK